MTQLESVDNALRLILLLARGDRHAVKEVASELGVAPSTAHRLLATLVARGFVEQLADRSYRAGNVIRTLGAEGMTRATLLEVSRTPMLDLVREVDETCHIAVLENRRVYFVHSEQGHHVLRIGSRAGQLMPAHRSACGKAMLATLPPEVVAERYPPEGVASLDLDPQEREKLLRELVQVSRRGFAVNRNGAERGVSAVAVAIRQGNEAAVAALTLSVPTMRFTSGRIPELLAPMVETAARIAVAVAASTR